MIQPVPCQAIDHINTPGEIGNISEWCNFYSKHSHTKCSTCIICQSESLSRVVWATVGCKHCDCGNRLVLGQYEGYHSCDNSNWILRANGSSGTSLTLHTYTYCSPFACRPSVRSICPTSPSASIDSFPVQPLTANHLVLLVCINCYICH